MNITKKNISIGLLLIAFGVIIMLVLIKTKTKTLKTPLLNQQPLVDVMKLNVKSYTPVVKGFGIVRPSELLTIVMEVGGDVIEIGKSMVEGGHVEKGDLLYKIDDSTILVDIEQTKAQIASFEARIAELEIQNKTDGELLEIEDSLLTLAQKEYSQKLELRKAGSLSQSALEDVEIRVKEKMLISQKRKASMRSFLQRLSILQADKKSLLAVLDKQKILLEKTVVYAPFRFRIIDHSLTLHRFYQSGTIVINGFPLGKPTEISVPVERRFLSALFDMQNQEMGVPPWSKNQLSVQVTWDHLGQQCEVAGKLSRFGAQVDADTRSLTAIIEIPTPENRIGKNSMRGLLPGTFTTVHIQGRNLENVMIIPEKVLTSEGNIYLLSENKLHVVKPVSLFTIDGDLICSPSDILKDGALVVTTKVPGAFDGMSVKVDLKGTAK